MFAFTAFKHQVFSLSGPVFGRRVCASISPLYFLILFHMDIFVYTEMLDVCRVHLGLAFSMMLDDSW